MKYQFWNRKLKHQSMETFKSVQGLWRLPWFRIGLLLVLILVVWRKNVHLDISLFSPRSTEVAPLAPDVKPSTQEVQPVSLFDEVPYHLLRHMPTAADTNIANTYSNLGFILNPGLATRLKVSPAVVAIKARKVQAYLAAYAPIAVEEMKAHGIPASITLAQGLLESNVGDSKLAQRNNNHFGIKCFSRSCAKGHCSNYTDDSHKDFFRIYTDAEESYREHSTFLKRDRYRHLQQYPATDYKSWAHGLKKAGYATDPRYAYKLIDIIEALDLHQYDQPARRRKKR